MGHLAGLSGDRKTHAVRRKQTIYLEGDEVTRGYFVQAGRVKTVKTTEGGKELITGFYGPGEFFGYLPLLEHTLHSDSPWPSTMRSWCTFRRMTFRSCCCAIRR
ncbi:cyclic nucleotide-binding domain-containing protein [Hymenobacter sp. BRD128]|uniref:cyclic nucleotide-binding domain-containing protein n=1 Tax=Hymenobacter sp. BRD128 TaxID=2675878 RepID=UPI00349F0641